MPDILRTYWKTFDHSIGLIVHILTTQKNAAFSESFTKIHSELTKILQFLFSCDHSIGLIVHHPTSRVGQCCFDPKTSKKLRGWGSITQECNVALCSFFPEKKAKKIFLLVGVGGGVHCPTQMSL